MRYAKTLMPAIVLALAGTESYAGALSLAAKVNYGTGSLPYGVVTADLNHDGKADMVSVNNGANSVSVLLGNGDGTFKTRVNYATGAQPTAVVVADVNGDGNPDVATSNQTGNSVSLLLGNGDSTGTLKGKVDFTTGTSPESLVFADINNDGKQDIVASNNGSNTISVLLGNGAGSFAAKKDSATGAGPLGLAVGDVNRDGKADVVVTNWQANTVSLLPGKGDGTFLAKVDAAVGGNPQSATLADVNRDGKLDLAVTNNLDNTVSVLIGQGSTTFVAAVAYPTGTNPDGLTVRDMNLDARPDLVVSNSASNTLNVLLGNGNGTFQNKINFSSGTHPDGLVAMDVNHDSKPDVLVANQNSSTASVLLNNTSYGTIGKFQGAVSSPVTVGTTPIQIDQGDINRDGKADLVVTNNYDNTVSVLLGKGDGSFQAKLDYATGRSPIGVALTDINGDGKLDLAVANHFDSTVSLLLGKGNGIFNAKTDIPISSALNSNESPTDIVAADINNDGKQDLMVASDSFWINTVKVLLGNGNGTFGTNMECATVPTPPGSPTNRPVTLAVGDLNNDGKADLAVTNQYLSSVGILLGIGQVSTGTCPANTDFTTGAFPSGVAIADLNHDGKADVVTTNQGGNTVSVLMGQGNGNLANKVDYATDLSPVHLAVNDFNGDGVPDLVTTNYYHDINTSISTNSMSLLTGKGDGTFNTVVIYSNTFPHPDGITSADFNRDGKADFAAVNYGNNSVDVFLNGAP